MKEEGILITMDRIYLGLVKTKEIVLTNDCRKDFALFENLSFPDSNK